LQRFGVVVFAPVFVLIRLGGFARLTNEDPLEWRLPVYARQNLLRGYSR